ncbi:hypothetical protein [Streptomyces sp. NPDC004546]
MSRKDLLFFFGAGVSLLAAVVWKLFGPFIGGVFLAFPAILLASLALVAKERRVCAAPATTPAAPHWEPSGFWRSP